MNKVLARIYHDFHAENHLGEVLGKSPNLKSIPPTPATTLLNSHTQHCKQCCHHRQKKRLSLALSSSFPCSIAPFFLDNSSISWVVESVNNPFPSVEKERNDEFHRSIQARLAQRSLEELFFCFSVGNYAFERFLLADVKDT